MILLEVKVFLRFGMRGGENLFQLVEFHSKEWEGGRNPHDPKILRGKWKPRGSGFGTAPILLCRVSQDGRVFVYQGPVPDVVPFFPWGQGEGTSEFDSFMFPGSSWWVAGMAVWKSWISKAAAETPRPWHSGKAVGESQPQCLGFGGRWLLERLYVVKCVSLFLIVKEFQIIN